MSQHNVSTHSTHPQVGRPPTDTPRATQKRRSKERCKNRKKVEEVLTTLGPNAGQMVGEWLQSPQRPGTTGKSKNSSPALEDVRSVCSAPDKATRDVMSNLQGLMNGLPERAEHRVELASHITGGMNSREIRSKFGSISKKTIEKARKLRRAAGDQKGPSSSDTKSSSPTINETKAENSQAVITPVASSRRKKGCKRKRQNDSTTAAMVDHTCLGFFKIQILNKVATLTAPGEILGT